MPLPDGLTIGNNLRKMIIERGLTQAAFARDLGYSRARVNEFCSGDLPFLTSLKRFCDVLDCSVEELLCLDRPDPDVITKAQIDLARADGLCRGLLCRNSIHTVFNDEETIRKYWSTLITDNRNRLEVLDDEWRKFIKPLFAKLQDDEKYSVLDEDYVNVVLQVCHYLFYRMRFDERIRLTQLAQKRAARLSKRATDPAKKRNWLAAQLILAVDGEFFARIEICDVSNLPYELAKVEGIARENNLHHLAEFAHIVRARALLYEDVASATTLVERGAIMKKNAPKARKELENIQTPDWEDYLITNRYYAVWAEIALAEQEFDDAILFYSLMLEHNAPEIELNVGTYCSLIYAHVMKALANPGSIQENEIREAKRLLNADQSDKLFGEDLLNRITKVYLLLLDKNPVEALNLAQSTRGHFKRVRGIQENHNLIRVLNMLIQDLKAGSPII